MASPSLTDPAPAADPQSGFTPPKFAAEAVSAWYGPVRALERVSLEIPPASVTALIGPSGCGKTTFLRCLNRMIETIPAARTTGTVRLDGADIAAPGVDVAELRARVGMVFEKPAPFPKSVFENVAYGPRIHGLAHSRAELEVIVESALRSAALWDEVKDRLATLGTALAPGQQQRLCIARAIATQPEVLLMDEPAGALDPIATSLLEALIDELRATYTIVVVTHSMQQAARISQRTAFLDRGRLVEEGPTTEILSTPREKRTEDYITGKIG